jgi:hypothetical protein
MRDTRRAAARFVAATAGFLTLMCTGCQDSNGPVDWLSAVRGAWTGELRARLVHQPSDIAGGYGCGALSVTIEAASDGQLSGSWTLAGSQLFYCPASSGTLAGLITGQTVTLSLTTSGGSNLFLELSNLLSCGGPVTAAQSVTGTISGEGRAVWLDLHADAHLGFWARIDLFSSECLPGSGAWLWHPWNGREP